MGVGVCRLQGAALATMWTGLAACAAGRLPSATTVSLRMQGTPADASVVIDDIAVGPLGYVQDHGVALPVGTHTVTVAAPGYFPCDRLVRAAAGRGPIRLEIHLDPIPD